MERTRVNLVSLLVTLGVLFVAVELSSGSFAKRINRISEKLDRTLERAFGDNPVNYTDYVDNSTYVSQRGFNPRGMAGLYNITNSFIDLILPKNFLPEGILTVENNQIQWHFQNDWSNLGLQYAGVLTMVIILLLIGVLLILCGFFFCCCRCCCGKCGARSQPFDKKHDFCKKILFATFLIGLGTLLLFGVVCVFVSNQHMQEGIDELPENLKKNVKDVNTYLKNTEDYLNLLLIDNSEQLQTNLFITMDNCSYEIYDQLVEYSNALSMTQVVVFIDTLPNIENNFKTLKYSVNALRVYASQLNDAIRQVKKEMLIILNGQECQNIPQCKGNSITQNINSLQTNIHFNNLPDITDKINLFESQIDIPQLTDIAQKGLKQLQNIQDQLYTSVNETLAKVKSKTTEFRSETIKNIGQVTGAIGDIRTTIDREATPILSKADEYIKNYGPYRYYVALVISCLVLLITLFVALGLICGICGKRPAGYGDDCCNKGTGSCFLICGVYWMFLSGIVIVVVVLVSFILGIVTQRLACDSIRNPEKSEIFGLVDNITFTDDIDIPLSKIITNCYENKSAYDVFHLQHKFDVDQISDYVSKFNIDQLLDNLKFDSDEINNFQMLGEDEMNKLRELASSQLDDIPFDEFETSLNSNFTTVNLSEVSTALQSLIDSVDSISPQLSHLLQVQKNNIEMYQQRILEPMQKNATDVLTVTGNLQVNLKLNHSSFSEGMTALIDEVVDAQNYIKTHGTQFLNQTIHTFAKNIISRIQGYIDRIIDKTKTDVGQCGPLSLVINSTMTSTCDKILLPWNGYWFGLFWSLIVFIPTIIISVYLSVLYQKHSAYSRDMVETRGSKAKKKNKKHKRYEDRPLPSAGGDMVVREYPGGSNHQDARYADMAPKQWEDFPAGGPPQYQRAPTEYERPPPYYYPGAGDNAQ